MPRPEIFPTLATRSVEDVVAFVRANQITAAHYFGYADEGLIRALQAEPDFTITLTDYFDRWGGSDRFWGKDYDEQPDPPPCPSWMENVICYQEGMPAVTLLIWDLARTEDEKVEFNIGRFDFIILMGAALLGFKGLPGFDGERQEDIWLGSRKHSAP